jgi:predicted nucleotidyltransferase
MTRAEALRQLRSCEGTARQLGITLLSLFDSPPHDPARDDSDVDLVASVKDDAIRVLGPFDRFGIEGKIEAMLGAKVDCMTEPAQKPWLQEEIDRDREYVF